MKSEGIQQPTMTTDSFAWFFRYQDSSYIDNCGPTDDDAVCVCGCSGYDEWCGSTKCLMTHRQASPNA